MFFIDFFFILKHEEIFFIKNNLASALLGSFFSLQIILSKIKFDKTSVES